MVCPVFSGTFCYALSVLCLILIVLACLVSVFHSNVAYIKNPFPSMEEHIFNMMQSRWAAGNYGCFCLAKCLKAPMKNPLPRAREKMNQTHRSTKSRCFAHGSVGTPKLMLALWNKDLTEIPLYLGASPNSPWNNTHIYIYDHWLVVWNIFAIYWE
jgi:hypothetical protein